MTSAFTPRRRSDRAASTNEAGTPSWSLRELTGEAPEPDERRELRNAEREHASHQRIRSSYRDAIIRDRGDDVLTAIRRRAEVLGIDLSAIDRMFATRG